MTLREFPSDTVALARSPIVAVALGASAAAGAALTRLPLFDVPGWELGSAMAVAMSVAGGIIGARAARRVRQHAEDRTVGAGEAVARAFLPAAFLCMAALVPPFIASVAGALLSTRCNPWSGAAFYLVLPIPSGLFSCAIGVAVGFAIRRVWQCVAAYLGALVTSIALSLWPLWSGPQVFALNHFLGYFPGPLYDEALQLESRLLVYRALTLAWTGVVLLVAAALLDPRNGRFRRRASVSAGQVATAGLLLGLIALGHVFDFELGLRTRALDLDRALGGTSETAHFVFHFPRSKPALDIRRLERDLEYKYDRVVSFLGAAPPGKIHAYFHTSPEEKRRLVGASETSFAKPWRLEFHVHDEPFPHSIARHEMAHAVAAAFGAMPFGVSARRLIQVNIGLVEGLAVAADDRADELTLHQWAAAMRRLKLAPDIRGIVGPAGFYRQPATRAYTLAGSFLRFLCERHGSARLREAYRAGDFESAYGKPLDALASEWELFLDAMPLDERAMHTAEVRFERPSLFQRPCAREVAALKGEADAWRQSDPERALALYRRCAAIEPKSPTYLRAQAEILAARHDWEGAREIWQRILRLPDASAGTRAAASMGLGDAFWAQGRPEDARKAFEATLALRRDRATDRTALVKLGALDDATASPIMRRYFEKSADLPHVLAVQELTQLEPENAHASYLVGRRLLQHADATGAVRYLEKAVSNGRAAPEVAAEAWRLLAQASYLAGSCAGVRSALDRRVEHGDAADEALAEDWRNRCAFEERTWGGPIEPSD